MWEIYLRDAAGNEVPAPGRSSFMFKFVAKSDLRDLQRGISRFGAPWLAVKYRLDASAETFRLSTGPGYPGATVDASGRGLVVLDLRTAQAHLRRT